MRSKILLRILTLIILVTFAITSIPAAADLAYAAGQSQDSALNTMAKASGNFRQISYEQYLAEYKDKPKPDVEIIIPAESYTRVDEMEVKAVKGFNGFEGTSVLTGDEGSIEWEVDIQQEGLYNIAVKYYPIEGKSASAERELLVDGYIPFEGARTLLFERVWKNESSEIERDGRDNDLRPRQIESPMWREVAIRDKSGYYNDPFKFYFSRGKHTIKLVSVREPLAIGQLRLYQEASVPDYNELKDEYIKKGYKNASGFFEKYQGEKAVLKSDPTLYPINDRSSPATEPYHTSKIRMNAIGGNNWKISGQWLVWDIEVPEDGLYNIGIKYRQNFRRGLFSNRRILIDDKVPFRQVENIPFVYNNNWKMKVLGDDKPYMFYLTKGKHQIKVEATLGEMASIIRTIEDSILELNTVYRKILMITGRDPDPYRDYFLVKQIPNMLDIFKEQSETMYSLVDQLKKITGQKGSHTAVLQKVGYQLKDIVNKPESITTKKRFDAYKTNVGALGSWILEAIEQPLDIDYIVVASPEQKIPEVDVNFVSKLLHEVKSFFYSFIEDYSFIGNTDKTGEVITVWMGGGRDQAQVVKAMIDDSFTPNTGIQVNLRLIDPNAVLLQAIVAGQGPDVALGIPKSTPVNFAIRNAVQDLSGFEGFSEVVERFRESSLTPYKFQNGVYALPETETYNMMFYRKDILEELNIAIPQTWEDVFKLVPTLQKRHLEFALPDPTKTPGDISFATFLYQNDGQFYKNNGVASDLDSEQAMKAFKMWTEFYTNYKLPKEFDMPSRFRRGELPLAISDYTLYNTLSVSAPEIRGLWDFAPIPGVKKADGTIRRETSNGSSSCIMVKLSNKKQSAWEFMKWWTSKDAQMRFGREMESILGASARHPSANKEALSELPWPTRHFRNLIEQGKWVKGIPEVPGGYFTPRHVDNAFRKVILNGDNPRETLLDYINYINEEIALKRQEFGLD